MAGFCRGGSKKLLSLGVFLATFALGIPSFAQTKPDCSALPNADLLRKTLQSVVREGPNKNGGMGNQEWAVTVNRDGIACAVVFSGTNRSQEGPGSRVMQLPKQIRPMGSAARIMRFPPRMSMQPRNLAKVFIVWQRALRQTPSRSLVIRSASAHRTIPCWARRSVE
jgi:hypothetical protein